jgi:PPOX class probable F420-dependent enzyme
MGVQDDRLSRRYARAMSLAVRAGKAMDRVYLRIRHAKAFDVTSGEAGSFGSLRGRKYALIVTFRRNGKAVPTPTWFGLGQDGNVYTRTFADAGKVKRLRSNPRALLAPCDIRGKPLGPAIEGHARLLGPEEWDRAEQAIQANYGLGRRIYTAPSKNSQASTYIEIAPQSS